jgi:vesicle-fusing ATPase
MEISTLTIFLIATLALLLIARGNFTSAFITPQSSRFRHNLKHLHSAIEKPKPVDIYSSNNNNISISTINEPIFKLISQLAITTLYQSDIKRDAKGQGGGAQGSSATNWIDEESSFALKAALDKLTITRPDAISGMERDEAISWIRWMKATPVPLIVDLTEEFIAAGNETVTAQALKHLNIPREDFFGRISCKLILLPSGANLKYPMVETTGAILFGKLLYGGVTRYRLLGSSTSTRPSRRVGEHTSIKSSLGDDVPTWVQFGGSERKYEAVDMGSSAVLELSLSGKKEERIGGGAGYGEMRLTKIHWDPHKMFDYTPNAYSEDGGDANVNVNGNVNGNANENIINGDSAHDVLMGNSAMNLGGKKRNDAFTTDFKSAVGGLDHQIEVIVRRVLDGRVIRPMEEDSGSFVEEGSLMEMTDGELSQASLEADELEILGLTPVRGLLLYGPPGCGKTALAREISRSLQARTPKILSAPELLDKWVGSSEKLSKYCISCMSCKLVLMVRVLR